MLVMWLIAQGHDGTVVYTRLSTIFLDTSLVAGGTAIKIKAESQACPEA